jgi:tetratricopeptide (TPR) repeat protein
MIKKIFCFLFSYFYVSFFAQPISDSLVANADKFEDNFYEAIKQKSIENHDKAIIFLEKCLDKNQNEVIYYELGKNYLALKNLQNAYQYFEKSHLLNPKNRWYLDSMYEVNKINKDYKLGEINLKKLIEIKKEYQEELVSLYMITNQYKEAKKLIDELDFTVGKSNTREQFKKNLAVLDKPINNENSLLAAIKNNPKEEQNYIQLIYFYSEIGKEDKVLEIANQLKDELPNSDWANVSLFKIYLEKNEINLAKSSLFKILEKKDFDAKIRHKMLNEFLVYVHKNQTNFEVLEKAVSYFSEDKIPVAKEVGKFFHNKNNIDLAYFYYNYYYKNNPEDIENLSLLLQILELKKDFVNLEKLTLENLEKYPMQPELYYYKSVVSIGNNNPKQAIQNLNEGFELIIDNKNLEIMFYKQYVKIYSSLNDIKNQEKYKEKLNQLK